MSLAGKKGNLKVLDFSPIKTWSDKLPKVIWQGIDLTPQSENACWDLSSLPFGKAFLSVYSELEFTEYLRLFALMKQLELPQIEAESLAKIFSHPISPEIERLAAIFITLPSSFQSWSDQKGLKFSDLRPLLRKTSKEMDAHLDQFDKISASKSQGAELLELLIDLQDQALPENFPPSLNANQWLEVLRSQIRPVTSSLDKKKAEEIKSWSWPSETKGIWSRWGDQSGLSIQIQTHSPEDLEKKLQQLTRISTEWRSKV